MPDQDLGLEVPAFGAQAGLQAISLGATRIELNALGSYSAGGLTPRFEDFIMFTSASHPSIPMRIMIRPRGPPADTAGRDFVYTEDEIEDMEAGIRAFQATGLLRAERGDGFVFGILGEEGTGKGGCWVDEKQCARLVRAARPLKCVFHRAFDELVSCPGSEGAWEAGLQAIAACGFDGILTSGGLGRAVDHMETLGEIIRRAGALGVEIIVGGGVRTANAGKLIQGLALMGGGSSASASGRVYLHSACLYPDHGEDINPGEVEGIVAQLRRRN